MTPLTVLPISSAISSTVKLSISTPAKGSGKADPLAGVEIDDLTVEEIADEIGKTVRGVKTMLTRRGLVCADYDGSARKERVQ